MNAQFLSSMLQVLCLLKTLQEVSLLPEVGKRNFNYLVSVEENGHTDVLEPKGCYYKH